MNEQLKLLADSLEGELHYDRLMRILYATDASVYRELPTAVALPKTVEDIKKIIAFASANNLSIIPRSAGTSLAGQCVGAGIVVDISKYMNKILEINPEEQWVRVQPGVIRDQLNAALKPFGLFFGPNTSTANRCMLGGMVGNNSSGTTSIKYGTTRDHVLELKTVLSDGSEATFHELTEQAFLDKTIGNTLENKIYQQIHTMLSNPKNQENIRREYPDPSIHRRNTGYAVDVLLETEPFGGGEPFNFCKFLAGSEGTLAFTTEIKLHVDLLPPPHDVVVAAHFESMSDCMEAVLIAMEYEPYACELMDKIILDCTKDNLEQQKNRFFLHGDPQAVLMIEFRGKTLQAAESIADQMIENMRLAKLGYAFPKVYAPKTKNVWDLRSAGLGVLSNMPGEAKAVACIEDTAVALKDLPAYIADFTKMMEGFGQKSVYYAHAGAGELHLRPILDLKKTKDVRLFHDITESTAKLVKRYNGSLSGEHGDGRVRAEFIPLMIGKENYALIQQIKQTWDAQNIFNPGKIVNAIPMTESLRYEPEVVPRKYDTVFDFSDSDGILGMAEKCNGSGDCRKLSLSGGTMCPSYRATRHETETTRGRANALREILTRDAHLENPFNNEELKQVMDLCLSCKGCTSECPSNVDLSTLKAEFLHHYYQANGVPLRAKAFANINRLNALGAIFPSLSNAVLNGKLTSSILKKVLGVAPARSLPALAAMPLKNWFKKYKKRLPTNSVAAKGKVYLFADEFTNFNDAHIGQKAVELLTKLGYEVEIPKHEESGRAALSKGLLPMAQAFANKNVELLKDIVSANTPLIGIEPSAILSFRDEYPRLVDKKLKSAALELKKHIFLIDEFLKKEVEKGNITSEQFTQAERKILLHGHCHQKALSNVSDTAWLLSLPQNYEVQIIPSGCCGMAGSFGYEKEHYEVSMKIGEDVLFPAIRAANGSTIAAPGTSCRHQIMDGTNKAAKHPVEILWEALI